MTIKVTVNGVKYDSLAALGKAYNQLPTTVARRYEKGLRGMDLVQDHSNIGHRNRSRKVKIEGKEFPSVKAASEYYGIKRTVFNKRLLRYEKGKISFEELINKTSNRTHPVVLQGIKYKSINEAARQHHMYPARLANRIKKYGVDSPVLFDLRTLQYHPSKGHSTFNIDYESRKIFYNKKKAH